MVQKQTCAGHFILNSSKEKCTFKTEKSEYMDVLMEQMKQKPNLKILVDELNQIIEDENKRREEFYDTITESDKAEFINGEIVMHSPVKLEHARASGKLFSLMQFYVIKHDLGQVHTEKIMIQLTRNSYEPDIVFFAKEKAEKFTQKQMLFPAPDLIVEVLSPTTEINDRGIKFIDYALHGVQEYWLIDATHQSVEQYLLQDEKFELEFKGKAGTIFSRAITSFQIEVKAVFDEQESLKALQQILQM